MLAWRRRGQGARQHDHHGVEDAAEGAVDGSGNSALRPVRVADAVGGERGRGGDVENALEEAGRVDGGLVDVDAEDKPSPGQGETLGGRYVADKKAELILLNSRAVQTSIVHNKVRQGVVDGERDGAVGHSAVGRGGREIIAERKPRGVEWLRAEEVQTTLAKTGKMSEMRRVNRMSSDKNVLFTSVLPVRHWAGAYIMMLPADTATFL